MRHAVTIIDHADHALAAHLDFDANSVRACVQRIFEQLFHHRRGPLDNLARSDFVRYRFRQYAYAAHFAPGPDLAVRSSPRAVGSRFPEVQGNTSNATTARTLSPIKIITVSTVISSHGTVCFSTNWTSN